MKQKLAQYILFVYEHYIKEEWSVLTMFGKIVIYPFWLIRIPIVTLYSIFCFPFVLLHMYIKKFDKEFELIKFKLFEIQQKCQC